MKSLEIAVIGTDTSVGKTRVVELLVRGLRAQGRRVWVHKPVACGGWDGSTCDDGRTLSALIGDGQPTGSICPIQLPEPASPHLAARAAGVTYHLDRLVANLGRCRGEHDLVVEGVGGLLVPLTAADETICDVLVRTPMPALLVARPDLGTINHTLLTVKHARWVGLRLAGLVVNRPRPVADTLATRTAPSELARLTRLPLLADLAHGAASTCAADDLATAVIAACR
ncbi:MAG: dethiobiotin synthase [Planctomycetes bacterium]|nr:dethiobiotin synthase [Planctomycetota bacterium]